MRTATLGFMVSLLGAWDCSLREGRGERTVSSLLPFWQCPRLPSSLWQRSGLPTFLGSLLRLLDTVRGVLWEMGGGRVPG